MRLLTCGLAALLTCLPLTVEAMPKPEVRALNNAERDRYFREANLAIMKYYQCLDEANALADEFKKELKDAVWGQAIDACTVISISPGTAYHKGIVILINIMAEFRKSDYFCGLHGDALARAKRVDELFAQAEAWYHTYVRARESLMQNRHVKGMADRHANAETCISRYLVDIYHINCLISDILYNEGPADEENWENEVDCFESLLYDLNMVKFDPYSARKALKILWSEYGRFTPFRAFRIGYGESCDEVYEEWQEMIEEHFVSADHHLKRYFTILGLDYKQ